MSSEKEIRTKIQSIKNTQKITKAMEMVAASKMRKAQDRMATSRPYAERIYRVIQHLALGKSEYHHPYLSSRTAKRVGFIVVSTDRGLCGGLNTNLFKQTLKDIQSWQAKSAEIDLCLIGRKAENFFKRVDANVVASQANLGDVPNIKDLVGLVKVMLENYDHGKIDALFVVYNRFVNTMAQVAKSDQLLPLLPQAEEGMSEYWDYIYEPDAKELLDELLTRYIESIVYQSVVENFACEQAARMVAMKSATDNAGNLIDEFQTAYNKARQAAITQEISEIVGGAAAV